MKLLVNAMVGFQCRKFYSRKELVNFYKSFVLSFIEFGTPAFYHATVFALTPLDWVQNRMLEEVGLSEIDALVHYALAPLGCRRDMAIMGLLHRINNNEAPESMSAYFFPEYRVMFPRGFRERHLRRNRQLHDYRDGSDSRIFQRSIFGLINAYNLLPQCVVDLKSTHTFQHHLQRALKEAASIDGFAWKTLYSVGVRRMSVSRFHA